MSERISFDVLGDAIESAWGKDTSADPDNWFPFISSWGQCAVTALAVQDFWGGDLLRLDLSNHRDPKVKAMRSHYYNLIGEEEIDFSSSQFQDKVEFQRVKSAQDLTVKKRGYLFENKDTVRRYSYLRLRIAKVLSGNNQLFESEIYRRCLLLAFHSDCQAGKFGCVVLQSSSDRIVAETCNKILEPLKGWCEPRCVRMDIAPRTESMIGCCAHAEELALVKLRHVRVDPEQCCFYVAGIKPNGTLCVKEEKEFTCLRCAVQLYNFSAREIMVPFKNRWGALSAKECVAGAKLYAERAKVIHDFR